MLDQRTQEEQRLRPRKASPEISYGYALARTLSEAIQISGEHSLGQSIVGAEALQQEGKFFLNRSQPGRAEVK